LMRLTKKSLSKELTEKGVSRRDFLKFCTVMAGTLALSNSMIPKIAYALEQTVMRPPLVWLEFQDCAGDTESLLRASRPTVEELILDILSVDYHETIMAAAGHQAEKARKQTIEAGGHIVIVEGSIPLHEDGIYCCIGGHTAIDILEESTAKAAAVIAVGSCATFGGLPKVSPNPTGAVGVMDLVDHIPVINLSGCPMNVVNLTATVVHYLTFGEFPEVDKLLRPTFAHGKVIHETCERRAHFDAGRFVREWGDEGHRNGWCLYQMGCKGPVATFNCPTVRWNDGTNWPVGAGHGCIACAAPDFFERPIYEPVDLQEVTPPAYYPVAEPAVQAAEPSISKAAVATVGTVGGLVVGAVGALAVAAARSDKRKKAQTAVEVEQTGPPTAGPKTGEASEAADEAER
jgi:hydrogenase small subunit